MAVGTIELPGTGLEITRVGLGAWAIGGSGWWDAWGAQDDEQSIATIHRAVELGINWLDTAPIYGLGHSEEVVGRALEGLRPRPYVFTKAGLQDGGDGSVRNVLKRDSILREAELSLQRLRLDAIDVYQIHWPVPDEDVEEAWGAFAELREQGLVRHIGVSNFSVEQMRRARADRAGRDAAAAVLAARARHRGRDPAVHRAGRDRRRRLLAAGLGAAERGDDRRAGRGAARRRLALARPAVPRARAVPAPRARRAPAGGRRAPRRLSGAVAVAWTLQHPAVHGAIVGFRRPDQVEPLAGAGDIELTADDLAAIRTSTPAG